jgi:hypothetical protein
MLNVTLIINGVISGNLIIKRIEIEDIFLEPGKIGKFVECYRGEDIIYTVVCDNARIENKWPDQMGLEGFKNLIVKFRGINFDQEL